jgi:uncharacterized protein (TIGR02284 family)
MPRSDTIATLNRLIRCARDVEDLCAACSEAASGPALHTQLGTRSHDWGRQADELQALVLLLGGEPAVGASWRSPVTRLWLAVKAALLGPDDLLVLDTCLHAQLCALERFEDALEGYLPERIRRTVSLHAARIADRVEAIEALRGVHA